MVKMKSYTRIIKIVDSCENLDQFITTMQWLAKVSKKYNLHNDFVENKVMWNEITAYCDNKYSLLGGVK